MPRPQRPLVAEARDAADEQLYRAHENDPRPNALFDAQGNRLPLQAGDAALEKEWGERYAAALPPPGSATPAKKASDFPPQDVRTAVMPCRRHCIKISLLKHADLGWRGGRPKYWQGSPDPPYPYEPFKAQITDGPKDAALDGRASVKYTPIPAGNCSIRFHRFYEKIEALFRKNRFRTQAAPAVRPRQFWTIEVQVVDGLPAFARRNPVPLAGAPLHFSWDGNVNTRPETESKGAPFRFTQMEVGTTYSVKTPFEGAVEADTRIEVMSIEGDSAAVAHAIAGGELHLTVSQPNVVVKLRFTLRFHKVFVVGEGQKFAFAIPLAKKYSFGTHEAHGAVRGKALYVSKSDKKKRKWVIASQYDVDEPCEQLENMFVYRDPELERGRFDVTDAKCWHRVADTCGRDCEAVLFNNPHPGYGLHMCDSLGVQSESQFRGQYVSVHSIGSTTLVGRGSPEKVAFDNLGSNKGKASAQRNWLQGALKVVRDGSDPVNDFRRNPPAQLAIRKVFEPMEPYEDTPEKFKAVAIHYQPFLETQGLKDLLLVLYSEHGPSLLRRGGALFINGPSDVGKDLEDLKLTGFQQPAPQWLAHKVYYVEYQTNFTSESIHPSWFSIDNFVDNIREPKLSSAKAFIFQK